jgi:hypothetical protein
MSLSSRFPVSETLALQVYVPASSVLTFLISRPSLSMT